MNKMPEVYDDAEVFKKLLQENAKAILYCTPEVASWFVDEEYEDLLTLGDAVKISKWEEELKNVSVKLKEDMETREWDYVEMAQPFYSQWQEEDLKK